MFFGGTGGYEREKLGGSEGESVARLLIAVTPERSWIEEVQRSVVDFFWSCGLWVRAAALCLPVEEGGQ